MAQATYACTNCKPVDRSIIEVYQGLKDLNDAVSSAEASRISAEESRVSAESAREIGYNSDHYQAGIDHSAYAADHNRANADHDTAAADHDNAVADRNGYAADHAAAVSDHATASSDHSRAGVDHVTAGNDHATAVSDHSRATSDHNDSVTATAAALAAAAEASAAAADVGKYYGVFLSADLLPTDDDTPGYALVGTTSPLKVYNYDGTTWSDSGAVIDSIKGDTGETPDISIGTVTTVEPGTPAAASMTGTPEAPVLNLSIPQGLVGATPNFTIGTVTTGEPGTPVVVTLTGTPEAPVLNVTIPQGAQGNTGSSVAYPYELVNNLTTNDATKGLSAAQGVVLDGKVTQLEAKVTEFDGELGIGDGVPYSSFSRGNAAYTFSASGIVTHDAIATTGNAGEDKSFAVQSGTVLTIKANGNYPALVIFLTVPTFNYGHKPSTAGTFANGTTTGYAIPVNTSQSFVINTDCYLHIMEGANQSYWPGAIYVRDKDGNIQKLFDKTADLEESVQENESAIEDLNERFDDFDEELPSVTKVTSLIDALNYADMPFGTLSQDGTYRYLTGNFSQYNTKYGNVGRFKATAGMYRAFAKCLVEGPNGDTFNFRFFHANSYDGNTKENLSCNIVQFVDFGEVYDPGEVTGYFGVAFSNFGPHTSTSEYTIKLYGIYLIRCEDYPGIADVSEFLDYTGLDTYLSSSSMKAAYANSAGTAISAQHASEASIADESEKVLTPLAGKFIGAYGDSLVTYSSTGLSGVIGEYLNATVNIVGHGGGRTNNNDPGIKHGFCSIERMALIRKDVKCLVFWGGANDGYLFVNNGEVIPSRLGTIEDSPLGVADMFNYRVTDNNVSTIDTPGRTSTFYQAYQTFIRNAQILFPHALLICVTQYRAYQYVWPNYGQVALKVGWPQLIQAEKECADKWGTAVCDLYTKSGVSDGNCFSWLVDDGGSLIHPYSHTVDRCCNLILQTILKNTNLVDTGRQVTLNVKDKDIAELKEYLVDLRSEDEITVYTLADAITAFIQYCTDNEITLKNNMYLVFYTDQYAHSSGYFLTDYTNPSSQSSWEQWVQDIVFDMRREIDPATGELYGVQTLAQAIVNFNEKAQLEQWVLTVDYYMFFYVAVGSWEKYRLTTPNAPSASSSWTKVDEGTDN